MRQRVIVILSRVAMDLGGRWPTARVDIFGSAATELSLGELSDVDICVRLPSSSGRDPKKLVYEIAAVLRRSPMYHRLEVIAHAKVPLVRCVLARANVTCDVVPNNMAGVLNSRFLAMHSKGEPLPPLPPPPPSTK